MIGAAWLRRLGRDGLGTVLRNRPEAIAAPSPRSLAELAERLVEPAAVITALRGLDRPTLQTAEALAALGGQDVPSQELHRLLGIPHAAGPQDVDRALTTLRQHALAWNSPDLCLVESARTAFGKPLGLGPPVATLLNTLTSEDLRGVARHLGLRPQGKKAAMVAQVSAAMADTEQLELLLSAGPPGSRQLLTSMANDGPAEFEYVHFSMRYGTVRTPKEWAMSVGLLIRLDPWEARLEMPAEVALALRGPSYTAPFQPAPPPVSWRDAGPAAVTADALASAADFLRLATGLLDQVAKSALPLLRSGGVGVRELRRLGKALRAPTGTVRLALAVVVRAGLLDVSTEVGLLTEGYDDWCRLEPPERMRELMRTWWTLPQAPTGAPEAAWQPHESTADARALRQEIVAAATGASTQAPADIRAVAKAALWRRPYGYLGEDALGVAEVCWQEAALLGAVGAGAVSPIGKALTNADDAGLMAALTPLGGAVRSLRMQADLTAIVSGTPAVELAELLDATAEREASGVASVWRFGPGSVRRALDAGHSAEDLLAELEAVSADPLPQPLRYLFQDVVRRHGSVRARTVACCLRSDDAALLAEIAADRRLRTLQLRPLAPTVLAGGQPLAVTLEALRAAGYAPVAESADGNVDVERPVRRRADPRPVSPIRSTISRPPPDPPLATDPDVLAQALLVAPDQASSVSVSDTFVAIRAVAAQLNYSQVRILTDAIDHGGAVWIDYVNAAGNPSRRVIEDVALDGELIVAWCRLRDGERMFSLSRISAVNPVGEGG